MVTLGPLGNNKGLLGPTRPAAAVEAAVTSAYQAGICYKKLKRCAKAAKKQKLHGDEVGRTAGCVAQKPAVSLN